MTVFNTFIYKLLSFHTKPLLSVHLNKLEFTVQNNSLLYTFYFTEYTARIGIRYLSNGLFEAVITLPINARHINEHQRQQFDTNHQGQVPITVNQLGTQAMGHEVAVIRGQHYPHIVGAEFPPNCVTGNIQYIFPLEEGQFPNSRFSSPDVNQVLSSVEESRILLQTVPSVVRSKLSIDTSTRSANDQQNFDPAQYYCSTDMSTTPSMTTPSIEDGTTHNPILLTGENSTTPISVQPTDPPAIFDCSRLFEN